MLPFTASVMLFTLLGLPSLLGLRMGKKGGDGGGWLIEQRSEDALLLACFSSFPCSCG